MHNLENVDSELALTIVPPLLLSKIRQGKRIIVQCSHWLSGRSERSLGPVTCASLNSATFPKGIEPRAEGAERPSCLNGGREHISGAN